MPCIVKHIQISELAKYGSKCLSKIGRNMVVPHLYTSWYIWRTSKRNLKILKATRKRKRRPCTQKKIVDSLMTIIEFKHNELQTSRRKVTAHHVKPSVMNKSQINTLLDKHKLRELTTTRVILKTFLNCIFRKSGKPKQACGWIQISTDWKHQQLKYLILEVKRFLKV